MSEAVSAQDSIPVAAPLWTDPTLIKGRRFYLGRANTAETRLKLHAIG
jgi:hypothetical protein